MAPSRDIAALVGKLKAKNGVEETKEVFRDLIYALIGEDKVVSASSEFVQAGGIEAVLDAMGQMPEDVCIQDLACAVLQSVPEGQVGKEKEVTELVLKAMKMFLRQNMVDDVEILSYRSAITTLLVPRSGSAAGLIAAKQEKGIEVLVKIMQKPFLTGEALKKRDLHLKALALIVYWIFYCNNENDDSWIIQQLHQSGGIPTLLLSMEQYIEDVHIQDYGCKLLLYWSLRGFAAAIVVDGGRSALERAKSRYSSHENIQKFANEALEILAAVDDADRCHKCFAMGTDMLQCSRCHKVFYCDRECQREDYNDHKKLCKLEAYQKKGTM